MMDLWWSCSRLLSFFLQLFKFVQGKSHLHDVEFWHIDTFREAFLHRQDFLRLQQWPPRSSTKSSQKAFQPNPAPRELPQTSAWPCRMTCCVDCFWCPLPRSVGCWHKHKPNRMCCLRVLAPEHAAPSRPETYKQAPHRSAQHKIGPASKKINFHEVALYIDHPICGPKSTLF